MRRLLKKKNSQAELITTVLIILIGIAAIALISTFVVNLVKKNLKSTDCLETASQFDINSDYSFFNSSSKMLYVSIKRAEKPFNLSGFRVTYGDDKSSKTIRIISGESNSLVYNLLRSGQPDVINRAISVPDPGLSKAYAIDATASGLNSVNKIAVFPILIGNQECEQVDEESISSRA